MIEDLSSCKSKFKFCREKMKELAQLELLPEQIEHGRLYVDRWLYSCAQCPDRADVLTVIKEEIYEEKSKN